MLSKRSDHACGVQMAYSFPPTLSICRKKSLIRWPRHDGGPEGHSLPPALGPHRDGVLETIPGHMQHELRPPPRFCSFRSPPLPLGQGDQDNAPNRPCARSAGRVCSRHTRRNLCPEIHERRPNRYTAIHSQRVPPGRHSLATPRTFRSDDCTHSVCLSESLQPPRSCGHPCVDGHNRLAFQGVTTGRILPQDPRHRSDRRTSKWCLGRPTAVSCTRTRSGAQSCLTNLNNPFCAAVRTRLPQRQPFSIMSHRRSRSSHGVTPLPMLLVTQ